MTFGAPMAVWWFLVALPIVGMFFFRNRPVEITTPSIVFWEAIRRSQRAVWIGNRFSRWLTLLAQLLIIAFLVAALVDPNPIRISDHVVVILDDSATMQTIEDEGRSRFDLARSAALQRIEAVPSGTPITIVLAGSPPKLVLRRQADITLVSSSLSDLTPRDVNADIDGSLKIVHGLTLNHSSSRLVVVTDVPRHPTVSSTRCEWIRIGTRQPNIGIATLDWVEDQNSVAVIVGQRGMSNKSAVVSLVVQEREIVSERVTLSDQPTEVLLSAELEPGQPFEVRVRPFDALQLDNSVYGVCPPRDQVKILLVTDGNLPLLAALSQPNAVIQITSWDAWHGGDDADVVVLDAPPSDRHLVDSGRYLVFGGSDPFDRTIEEPIRTTLRPTQWTPDHPLLEDVDLMGWRVERSCGIGCSSEVLPIVEAGRAALVFSIDDRSAIVDSAREPFVAVYISFTLEHSNLIARPGFPIFVWNAIYFLLHRSARQAVLAYPTGSPFHIPLGTDHSIRVLDPTGNEYAAIYDENGITVPNPEQSGVYRMEGLSGMHFVALNWMPDGVEDWYGDVNDNLSSTIDNRANSLASRKPIWWRLLFALLGLVIIEQWLFHRNILRMS